MAFLIPFTLSALSFLSFSCASFLALRLSTALLVLIDVKGKVSLDVATEEGVRVFCVDT